MAASEEKPGPARKEKRPPSRLRKWTRRITIFVLGFIFVVGVTIQIVLWTGIPRRIVVSQVEKGLGLRMGVESVSTGWFGRTALHGVKIALPLSDQSFVDAPDMKVRHTTLLGLIFGRPMVIREVDLDKPVIRVWQDPSGRWNLAEVVDLLTRVGGKKTGQETAGSEIPVLPSLSVKGLKAVVKDNRGRELTVEPINLVSGPETPISYAYDLEIPSGRSDVPPHVSAKGRIAPADAWSHTVRLWVNDVDPWIAVWKPGFNIPFTFDGNWTGQLADDGVKGFLQISEVNVDGYRASGAVSASRLDGMVRVAPSGLHLKTPVQGVPEVIVGRGEVTYDGTVVRLNRLVLAALGGPAEVNGWFDPALNQGAVEAFWQDMKTGAVRQSGKIDVSYKNPLASNLTLDVLASSSGTAPDGPFEAVVKLNATGRSFQNINWRFESPQLAYHRPQPIVLDGLTATGSYSQDTQHQIVRLASASLPADNRLNGTGSYDLKTEDGELHLNGQEWPVRVIEGTHLAYQLDATGRGVPGKDDPKQIKPLIELTQFFLRSGDTELTVKGHYDGREPKPVSAEVVFQNLPSGPSTSRPGEPSLIQGFLRGSAQLGGTLLPMKVEIKGRLASRNASVLDHLIGDMNTGLTGSIDYDKAVVRADAIPFLDGLWTLGATYITHQNDKPVYATEVDLSVEHLSLPKVSQFLDAPVVNGTFDGRWYLYFPGLKPKLSSLILTGGGGIDKLGSSSFIADKVTYKTTMKEGQFSIDPIEITRGSYGRVKAAVSGSVDNPRRIVAGFDLAQFPVEFGPVGVQTTGGSHQIVITLPNAKADDPLGRKLRVTGQVVTRTSVLIAQQPVGEIRSTTDFQGRTAQLTETDGDLLGGTFSGRGAADIDNLDQARLSFQWKSMQGDRLVRLFPQINGFGGTFSGNLNLHPATVSRPLEPLALDVFVHSAGGHWRTVQLGEAQVHAFLNPSTFQFIASEADPTSLQIGGGTVNLWFSGSRHIDTSPTPEGVEKQTGVTISNLVNLTLTNLEVDQFVQAFDPSHKPGLGRVNGAIYTLSAPKTKAIATLAAPTTAPTAPTTSPATRTTLPVMKQQTTMQHVLATTTVDANLRLAESNLAQFGPIEALYRFMHLGQDVRTMTGHGTVSLHMEQGQVHISNLYYFNRGIEVRGVATVDRMWELPDNTMSGSAVGTVRPLKSIKFPVLAEADAILTQIQGGLTGVEFAGTVKDPMKKYLRQIGLTEFGSELRGLLLGEIGANR